MASLLPFGEPIAVCRGHPLAQAALAIRDVGLPSTGPLGCRELRHRHSPALKQHGGPDQDSEGDERCDGGSDNRPEATTARKGRVRARIDLPWVARRGTLPTACGELCLRQGSSVLGLTLSVLKLGVRTRYKCHEMAPAVPAPVSGLLRAKSARIVRLRFAQPASATALTSSRSINARST